MRKFFSSALVAVAGTGCLGTPDIAGSAAGGSAPVTGGGSGNEPAMTAGSGGGGSVVGTTGGAPVVNGGAPGTSGSGTTTGGASTTGGAGGSGGSETRGGSSSSGGMGMGGTSSGGMPGTGGMVGAAGMGGAGGGTGSGATFPTLRVDDTCGSLLGGNVCLHAGKPSDNGTPFTKSAMVTMGGTAGMEYQVKIQVRGVVEPTHVQGGTPGTPPQFVTGGSRYADGTNESTYQQWRITTSSPNASYFLNVYSQGLSHVVYAINYMETIPIKGGSTVTLEVYDGNAHAISNTVVNPPLSIAGIPGSMMSGQFVQVDVVQ